MQHSPASRDPIPEHAYLCLLGELLDSQPRRVEWVGMALVAVFGAIAPLAGLAAMLLFGPLAYFLGDIPGLSRDTLGGFTLVGGVVLVLAGSVAGGLFYYRALRRARGGVWARLTEVLAFVVLPAWGIAYSHSAQTECVKTACGGEVYRPLAEPELVGLLMLHALSVSSYWISRRRAEALPPMVEALVGSALLVGIGVQALLAVHFGHFLFLGALLPPLLAPCLSPLMIGFFYAGELIRRLRRRGIEALVHPLPVLPVPLPKAGLHLPTLTRTLLAFPAIIGLYAVLHALWKGHPSAALDVFTRTCGYTLSQLSITQLPGDCHYLCTVAARGHARVVRPLRLGRRHGQPIVVNRQLAVANAFEDLLRERWPRFGVWARRIYDRFGPDICRFIRSPWLSDAVYVGMKPLEWGFYVALLVLDPGPPEVRIDRMYR